MSLDNELKIRLATWQDEEQILNFILGDFRESEPTNAALGLTVDETRDFFTGLFNYQYIFRSMLLVLVKDALKDPVSHIVVDSDGNIVGARLAQIVTRPDENSIPEEVSRKKYSNKLEILIEFLGIFEREVSLPIPPYIVNFFKRWKHLPSTVNKVIHGHLVSVNKNLARNGLGTKLALLSHQDALENGCQGVIIEATAYKSQKVCKILWKKINFLAIR